MKYISFQSCYETTQNVWLECFSKRIESYAHSAWSGLMFSPNFTNLHDKLSGNAFWWIHWGKTIILFNFLFYIKHSVNVNRISVKNTNIIDWIKIISI